MHDRGFARVPSAHPLERRVTFQIYDEHLTEVWLKGHWCDVLGDSDLA